MSSTSDVAEEDRTISTREETEGDSFMAASLSPAMYMLSDSRPQRALLELGLQTTPQGATNALSELDSDGDGSLDANELLMRISEFQRKRRVFANTVLLSIFEYVDRTNTSIMRVFACADRDGDGELDTVELQQALYKVGQNLSETEVDEIMYEIGGVARTETMTSMQFLDRLKQFEA